MKRLSFFRSILFGIATFGMTAIPVIAQVNSGYDSGYSTDSDADDGQDAPAYAPSSASIRTGYAHVTVMEGSASVLSDANGRTDMRINLPLSESDQIVTNAGGRAEIELADGNRVQISADTRVRLDALTGESTSRAEESALTLVEGSLAVEANSSDSAGAFRVDTPDASIYIAAGAQARINLEPNRGTAVIVRSGSIDVQTRSGSLPVRAGQYALIHGEDQPEIARGSFSRDRFDVWVADRSHTILQAHNSVSARYVEGDDDEDVAALDDYGSWDYSSTYGSQVWRPRVSADWSPYSDGYWYYTPAGATWVDYSPWGWYPHHYGNWFFDAGFSSWCWSPASVYSPGWVYWGYSAGYVGWCPMGYYSYYSPYRNYWGYGGGWGSGLYVGINGIFDVGRIDCGRGWNFVGHDAFGSRFDRGAVLPGSRVASRLGGRIAVSSDPLRAPMVSGRGSAGEAMRAYARSAPATISRQSSESRNASLTPFLARQRTLPADTVRTLRETQVARVNPASRTLQGPGASRLPAAAPRALSDRGVVGNRLPGGSFRNPGAPSRSETWRAPSRDGGSPRSFSRPPSRSAAPPSSSRSLSGDWRSRPSEGAPRTVAPPSSNRRSLDRPAPDGWRERSGSARPLSENLSRPASPGSRGSARPDGSSESWRSRPPAQRVIEGIDRGRALPPSRSEDFRSLPDRRSFESRPPARNERAAPPPSMDRRRADVPPPAYERRAEPTPRYERSAPPSFDRRADPPPSYNRRSDPSPRYERQAPPPSREMRSAPPAREYRAPAPSRSAPSAPSHRGEYRSSDGRSHG